MTTVTSRIGIVPTFGTLRLSPLFAGAAESRHSTRSSSGRIGWNAVTGSSDYAAMNFGLPGMPEHDLRYDMADEYMAGGPRSLVFVGAGARSSPTGKAAFLSIRRRVCLPIMPSERSADGDRRAK